MIRQFLSLTLKYGAAIVFTIIALGVSQASSLQASDPFLLFIIAVIFSAQYGGLGPGLVAGGLGVAASAYYFMPPSSSFLIEEGGDLLRLGTYAVSVLIVSWLTAAREQARTRAQTQARLQATVAELGQDALDIRELTLLFSKATARLGHALGVEYSQILEWGARGEEFLFRAGHGWHTDGADIINVGMNSHAGYTLTTTTPVIVRDWRTERRFNRCKLLSDHQIVSGMSVIIPGAEKPFGVLSVHSNRRRTFTDADVRFLQACAQVLAAATERIRAEMQMQAQREWLRVTLASIGDGVIVTDAHGAVNFINPAAQKLTGWSLPEADGRQVVQVFKVVDEKTGTPLENPVSRVIQSGAPVQLSGHKLLARRDGKLIAVDECAAPMYDETEQLIGVVLCFRDATVQRRIEQAIRQSEERFRVALKNSPFVVYNQDRDLRYTWVYNPTGGFPRQSDLGKTDQDLMPLADAARLTELKRTVLESGAGTREEIFATRDGQRRTFDLTLEPLRDAKGGVIGITCAAFDVTERKREQASMARLAAIVESSNDAIIGMTLDGIILSWNPGAERLYGYPADEIIGQSVSVLYPPDHLDEFRDVIARLKQGQAVNQYDTVRIRKDGIPIDLSENVSLVRDNLGRVIGASTIARDITERKRHEELSRFRAQASDVLAASLDYETTLTSIAHLAVPRMADWCAVHTLDENGALQQLALAHVDPAQIERAQELLRRYAADSEPAGIMQVIRTGQPEFIGRLPEEQRAAIARDAEHRGNLMNVGLRAVMIVPLTARQRTFGAITFVSAESGRNYSADDLAVAQDLANRAALSADNARLYRDVQQANDQLEQRVIQRTLELQQTNTQLQAEIAERQRTNEQLHLLSAHLQSAREEERARVAREIHDEFGQVLTAVKMDLTALTRKLSNRAATVPRDALLHQIRTTTSLVDDSVKKMREIIHELRPEILDHLGLKAAIEWQIQEFQTRTGIECILNDTSPEVPLDLERPTAVFRILQETLTNIVRHAHATRVHVNLSFEQDQLVLIVQDNGRGITESEIANTKSFGILGIRERVLVFGGHVDWHGIPGKGTTVTVRIPLTGMSLSN